MAESNKVKDRDKVIYLVSFAAIVVALYFLLRKHGAGTTATSPVAASAVPAALPGMFYPLTTLGANPAIPATSINVSFTPASNTNEPTGYVPLYGFIGYGGQWF